MGDVCTDTPTRTIFATSTSQGGAVVSRSTSQSVSVGQGSVVTRSIQSGTSWIVTESTVAGSTETVQVEVPVTISGEQQVFTVPVSTLFAPCTSATPTSTTPTSTTPTSTPTSTTPTSTTPEPSQTPESQTSNTERASRSTSPTANQGTQNTNANATPTPTPSPSNQGGNSASATDNFTVISTSATTTLPNGSQSTVLIFSTSSLAPSGGLNGNNGGSSGKSGSNSTRSIAIGVGVAGGFIALIILIFGITWHLRRKRKNSMPLDDSEIWGTHHESKTPPMGSLTTNNTAPGYTYNPYSEVRTTAYAPVPTMSPPRARPMVLAESDDHRLSAGSFGPQPPSAGLTAPLLGRVKTADEILYEAAREDLPKSRASSATASHHTRLSETGVSHGPHASFAASHRTHGSLASRTSGSAVGLLDHPVPSSAHNSLHGDALAAQRYQDLMDAPAETERSMSPVSIAAPRLAIVNPDVDKDH